MLFRSELKAQGSMMTEMLQLVRELSTKELPRSPQPRRSPVKNKNIVKNALEWTLAILHHTNALYDVN